MHLSQVCPFTITTCFSSHMRWRDEAKDRRLSSNLSLVKVRALLCRNSPRQIAPFNTRSIQDMTFFHFVFDCSPVGSSLPMVSSQSQFKIIQGYFLLLSQCTYRQSSEITSSSARSKKTEPQYWLGFKKVCQKS